MAALGAVRVCAGFKTPAQMRAVSLGDWLSMLKLVRKQRGLIVPNETQFSCVTWLCIIIIHECRGKFNMFQYHVQFNVDVQLEIFGIVVGLLRPGISSNIPMTTDYNSCF